MNDEKTDLINLGQNAANSQAPTVLDEAGEVTPPTVPAGDFEGQDEAATVLSPSDQPRAPGGGGIPYYPPHGAQPGGQPGGAAKTELISLRQPPSFAWLVAVDGQLQGQIFQLKLGDTCIGREVGNDIVLPDEACSRQHAKIRVETLGDGSRQFVLFDLGSANGTYAGSKHNYQEEHNKVYRHELRDNEYVLLGDTTMAFKRLE